MSGFDASNVRLVLLAIFLAGTMLRARSHRLDRHWTLWLGALVAISLAAYLGGVRVHPATGRIQIHHWEVYHYYVGTKYFAELGHDGLYEATVIADFEDDRRGFRPATTIRDLKHGSRDVRRAEVVKRRGPIVERFGTAERWRQFKADIAFFRAADPERWRASEIQRDHGYNGTPLTTAILGGLAAWSPGGAASFLLAVAWVDLVLVLLLAGWIAARLGASAGLTFLFFWFANPFNDYEFTGGSFLRYNYFIALTLAVALFRDGKRAASGVCLALAALFRIFPIVFLLGLLGYDLINPRRRALLAANRNLYVAALVTAVVVLAATSAVDTPTTANPWLTQLEIVASRNAQHAPNGISLRFPFLYSGAHDVNAAIATAQRGEQLDWLAATTATFARRAPFYYAALAVFAGLCAAYARRAVEREAFFLGMVGIFAGFILSHYYFCMLSLIPLIFREERRVVSLLALGMSIVIATGWLGPLREALDLRYAVYSVEVALLLGSILLLKLTAGEGPPASASSLRAAPSS